MGIVVCCHVESSAARPVSRWVLSSVVMLSRAVECCSTSVEVGIVVCCHVESSAARPVSRWVLSSVVMLSRVLLD